MAKANLNNQKKRGRELAKKDKRAASVARAPAANPAAASNSRALAAAAFVRRMNKTP